MFSCDNCGKISNPKEKQNKVAVNRDKTYQEFRYEFDPKTKKNVKIAYETQGTELVTELSYCKDCYATHGEEVNGSENTQGKGRINKSLERGNSPIKKRSEINGGRSQRVG